MARYDLLTLCDICFKTLLDVCSTNNWMCIFTKKFRTLPPPTHSLGLFPKKKSFFLDPFPKQNVLKHISKWCKSLLWFDWFASQCKTGDNHITFLLLYGFVKKSVLLNNTYWTLNNSIPQPYLTCLCFVYWTSVVHCYTVDPQLCSHSIQSVHLRLNSHCLSNQYWPSTSYWPANSFQIAARQALIAGNHSHQYHHLDQAHLMRSQPSQKYSKNWKPSAPIQQMDKWCWKRSLEIIVMKKAKMVVVWNILVVFRECKKWWW